MAAIGGDLIEITWNHETLGSGVLYPKSAEDSTFDTGGYRSADDANMVDGSGAAIRQINRVRWSLEATCAWDMNGANELESMVGLSGSPVEAEWTVSHINGTVWKGKGSPVGDIQGNSNAATFTLKLSGGGKMVKITG